MSDDAQITQKMTMAYVIALLFIAVLAVGSHVILNQTIEQQRDAATVINIAGRQRMLSQQIALLAEDLVLRGGNAQGDFTKALDFMERSHRALINGNDLGVLHTPSGSIRALYYDGQNALDHLVTNYIGSGRSMLLAKTLDERLAAAKQIRVQARGVLLPTLDNVVSQYEQEANERSGSLRTVQNSVLAILILTLICEALFIFRPLVNRVKAYTVRLRETERHYQALAEASSEIAYRMSADWSTMQPLDGRELVASSDRPQTDWAWLDKNIPCEEHPRVRKAISDAIVGKTLFELEHRVLRPDGSNGWTLSRAVPILNDNQDLVAWFGAAGDITERKRGMELLQQARSEADRANAAKSRFLAAASHDLRQPLSSLSLYASLLSISNPPTARTVANIRECIGSLSALLTDLLDISKLEARVVTPNIRSFPIAAMLTSLDSILSPKAKAKSLELRYRPSNWMAHSDPVLFQRILGNLIENAIQYTEHGGVLVACRHRQGKNWVEVWDTGIGIEADQSTEIFEEFKQLGDQARNKGSGLGLAIVAKTTDLLGLEVQVRSRPGRGSVFAVELPLGLEAQVEQAPAASGLLFRALRIAVVEDNPIVRMALEDCLLQLGHQVVAADGKATLLAELGTLSPDIVVSDYRLAQGETGFDVITAVQARFGSTLPAILITGDTDPTLMRSLSERGIVVLHKPLELETLRATIEDLTN
jgi:signal transduction histidine kinase